MDHIVSLNQSGFIHKRIINENIIVAQDILYSIHRSKCKVRSFAIKVDLAKAYENIIWNFLDNVLDKFGLPEKVKNLIMMVVNSVFLRVLWKSDQGFSLKLEKDFAKVILYRPIFLCSVWISSPISSMML